MKKNGLDYKRQCCPDGSYANKYFGKKKGEPTWKFCIRKNAFGKGRPGAGFTKRELKLGKHWGKIPKVINSQPFVYDGFTNLQPNIVGEYCALHKTWQCNLPGHECFGDVNTYGPEAMIWAQAANPEVVKNKTATIKAV